MLKARVRAKQKATEEGEGKNRKRVSMPSDGLIGTCVVPNDNVGSITYSYYADSTLEVAEDNCSGLRGTFDATK